MPKLPWKRGDTGSEQPAINAYLPVQPVDYTSMPVVEDEGRLAAFWKLPALVRIMILVLPLLMIAGGAWALLQFAGSSHAQTVVSKPAPEIKLGEARVVNPSEIAIEGETRNVPDGAKITAQLLVDDEIADWADPKANGAIVQGDRIKLRLRKASSWADHLEATSVYSVELNIASDPPVTATQSLVVPARLADAFYGKPPVETATPEPTKTPPPPPTPTTDPGPPTLVVGTNATMLISPTLGTGVVSQPAGGGKLQPLMRTPDTRFFLVKDGTAVGWMPASQVQIDAAQAERITVTTPSEAAVRAGPMHATVSNGGNIRFHPNVKTGTVLAQMHAGESVTLNGRTPDGTWFHVVAPSAEGWVSVTLLAIDPRIGANVPVVTN